VQTKPHVAVIGAGAFGGWIALFLLRRGARVTLLDAWGPGNSRASSGGETRIIRATYGANQPYTRMAARALQLWTEHEKQWNRKFLHRTGVLWMAAEGNDQFERESLAALREENIACEELSVRELRQRWPQIQYDGVSWGLFEPSGGFLTARLACQAVVQGFIAEGGEYREVAAVPRDSEPGPWKALPLSDGSKLAADVYVFACGPWLGQMFPQTLGKKIRATKQDIFFFGTPAGDDRFSEGNLPVWGDHRERFFYGMPANRGHGFKVADDTRGADFDPTSGERIASPETLKVVREFLAMRFPPLKDAPLLETRVCQYENSPDEHFIVDRHPAASNVWLAGGGSGHGFKHGPAFGEMMADLVIREKEPDARFRLARFADSDPTHH